jgi:hypothetical protein
MPFPVLLWSLVIFASFWSYGEALRHVTTHTSLSKGIKKMPTTFPVAARTLVSEKVFDKIACILSNI